MTGPGKTGIRVTEAQHDQEFLPMKASDTGTAIKQPLPPGMGRPSGNAYVVRNPVNASLDDRKAATEEFRPKSGTHTGAVGSKPRRGKVGNGHDFAANQA